MNSLRLSHTYNTTNDANAKEKIPKKVNCLYFSYVNDNELNPKRKKIGKKSEESRKSSKSESYNILMERSKTLNYKKGSKIPRIGDLSRSSTLFEGNEQFYKNLEKKNLRNLDQETESTNITTTTSICPPKLLLYNKYGKQSLFDVSFIKNYDESVKEKSLIINNFGDFATEIYEQLEDFFSVNFFENYPNLENNEPLKILYSAGYLTSSENVTVPKDVVENVNLLFSLPNSKTIKITVKYMFRLKLAFFEDVKSLYNFFELCKDENLNENNKCEIINDLELTIFDSEIYNYLDKQIAEFEKIAFNFTNDFPKLIYVGGVDEFNNRNGYGKMIFYSDDEDPEKVFCYIRGEFYSGFPVEKMDAYDKGDNYLTAIKLLYENDLEDSSDSINVNNFDLGNRTRLNSSHTFENNYIDFNDDIENTQAIISCCQNLLSNISLIQTSKDENNNFLITDENEQVYCEVKNGILEDNQLTSEKIHLTIKDVLLYEGPIEKNLLNGKGVVVDISNEATYDGNLVDGVFDDDTIAAYSFPKNNFTHSKYEGQFKEGKIKGKGSILLRNGYNFLGNFVKSAQENCCIEYPESHAVVCKYEGSIDNFLPNGVGAMYFKDGGILYSENWFDGGFEKGKCKITYPDNHESYLTFDGEMSQGKFNGFGKLLYRNKDLYEGNFLDDLFDDFGKYQYGPNHLICEKFEGNFVEGDRTGIGKMYYKDGAILDGNKWEKGILYGKGTYFFPKSHPNCKKYIGEFSNDLPNGKGILYFTDDIFLEGNWLNGVFSGHGKASYPIDHKITKRCALENEGKQQTFDKNIYEGKNVGKDYIRKSLILANSMLLTPSITEEINLNDSFSESNINNSNQLVYSQRKISFYSEEIQEDQIYGKLCKVIEISLQKEKTLDESISKPHVPNLSNQNNLSLVDVDIKTENKYVCNCSIY